MGVTGVACIYTSSRVGRWGSGRGRAGDAGCTAGRGRACPLLSPRVLDSLQVCLQFTLSDGGAWFGGT